MAASYCEWLWPFVCEGVSAAAASSGVRSSHRLVLSVGECGESGVFPSVFGVITAKSYNRENTSKHRVRTRSHSVSTEMERKKMPWSNLVVIMLCSVDLV